MSNFILRGLQSYGSDQRTLGINRCNDWAGEAVVELEPDCLLDVGCGDASLLFKYLRKIPREFHGVEGAPDLKLAAEKRGVRVVSYDLNGRWPFETGKFDVVFCSQVIEHLHNTRLFVEETYRVLKPGGTAIITSENLCSMLNTMAMCLGYTPFSLMQLCGRYLGNPIGLHAGEAHDDNVPIDHPAYAGICGHVRVMTVRQAQELFTLSGFDAQVRSLSILPLPDGLSKVLEKWVIHRGHYLLIRGRKPN